MCHYFLRNLYCCCFSHLSILCVEIWRVSSTVVVSWITIIPVPCRLWGAQKFCMCIQHTTIHLVLDSNEKYSPILGWKEYNYILCPRRGNENLNTWTRLMAVGPRSCAQLNIGVTGSGTGILPGMRYRKLMSCSGLWIWIYYPQDLVTEKCDKPWWSL